LGETAGVTVLYVVAAVGGRVIHIHCGTIAAILSSSVIGQYRVAHRERAELVVDGATFGPAACNPVVGEGDVCYLQCAMVVYGPTTPICGADSFGEAALNEGQVPKGWLPVSPDDPYGFVAADCNVPTAVYGESRFVRGIRQRGGKGYGAACTIGEHYLVGTRVCVGLLYGRPEGPRTRVIGVGYGEGCGPCCAHAQASTAAL